MISRRMMPAKYVIAAVLLALPVSFMAACSGGIEEETAAAPAEVPALGAAQLGGGAGPTPLPVTPTPTPTPSPKQLSVYDPVWEGTFTVREAVAQTEKTTKIVLELMSPKLIGEGKDRRRDRGAIFIEGTTGWMALTFVQVDPETGNVSFRVKPINANFKGVLEGDKITGTVEQAVVSKGTFEVHANRDKTPQRRPDAETGGAL